jgi:hypothetical protein
VKMSNSNIVVFTFKVSNTIANVDFFFGTISHGT